MWMERRLHCLAWAWTRRWLCCCSSHLPLTCNSRARCSDRSAHFCNHNHRWHGTSDGWATGWTGHHAQKSCFHLDSFPDIFNTSATRACSSVQLLSNYDNFIGYDYTSNFNYNHYNFISCKNDNLSLQHFTSSHFVCLHQLSYFFFFRIKGVNPWRTLITSYLWEKVAVGKRLESNQSHSERA